MARELSDESIRYQAEAFAMLKDRNPSMTLAAFVRIKDLCSEDTLALRISYETIVNSQRRVG